MDPSVKLSAVLRSLTTLAESLRNSLHQRDPENDILVVDLKTTDMYLKVISQIQNTYKLDSNRLLFGRKVDNL